MIPPGKAGALITAALFLCLPACNSSTSPSAEEVSDFGTGITASDGSVATEERGAPPQANGGPSITATSSGSVTSGGIDLVRLRSASAIQTVYASIEGTDGYYQLQLATPTTDVTLTVALVTTLPTTRYTAVYRAASASGLVGEPVSVTNNVQPSSSGGISALFITVTAFKPFTFTFRGQTLTGHGGTSNLYEFDAVPAGTYVISGDLDTVINFDVGFAPSGIRGLLTFQSGSFVSLSGPGPEPGPCRIRYTAPPAAPVQSFSFQFGVTASGGPSSCS